MSPAALPGIEAGTLGVVRRENEVCMTGTAAGLPGMTTDDRPAPGVEASASSWSEATAAAVSSAPPRRVGSCR